MVPDGSRGKRDREQVGRIGLGNSEELEEWPGEEKGSEGGLGGWGLWMDEGQEEEEEDPDGRGFLGFDQP